MHPKMYCKNKILYQIVIFFVHAKEICESDHEMSLFDDENNFGCFGLLSSFKKRKSHQIICKISAILLWLQKYSYKK